MGSSADMPTYFRIIKAKRAQTAMDGEGARINGGRWNPPGVAVVYLAASRALAALETLVHTGRDAVLWDWRVICVTVPDELIDKPEVAKLPTGWNAQPSSAVARKFGAAWVGGGTNPAILLPSAVIPAENALVLNVSHPGVSKIEISPPEPFLFDGRLG